MDMSLAGGRAVSLTSKVLVKIISLLLIHNSNSLAVVKCMLWSARVTMHALFKGRWPPRLIACVGEL